MECCETPLEMIENQGLRYHDRQDVECGALSDTSSGLEESFYDCSSPEDMVQSRPNENTIVQQEFIPSEENESHSDVSLSSEENSPKPKENKFVEKKRNLRVSLVSATKVLTHKVRSNSEYSQMVEHRPLTPDSYSMFFISPINSGAFWFSTLIYLMKMSLFIMLAYEITYPSPTVTADSVNCSTIDVCSENERIRWYIQQNNEKLSLSLDFKILTYVSQCIVIPLAVCMQSDILETYYLIANMEYLPAIMNHHPSATWKKYYISILMRFSDAVLSLLVNVIILFVEGTLILSMVLNFAALQFLQEIDNLAFNLAKDGYFGAYLITVANAVGDTKVKINKTNSFRNSLDTAFFFSTLLIVYVAWLVYNFQTIW